MKLLFVVFVISLCNMPAALAYIEDKDIDEADIAAGDQNTNLYRLQNDGMYKIKKLKEIDELVARKKAAGLYVDVSDMETLLTTSQQDKDNDILKNLEEDVDKQVVNPKKLKVEYTPDIYKNIIEIQRTGIKDKDVAATIMSELKQRGWR